MDDMLFRSLLAGVGLACVAGVLGCFIVWRRMAYFGDSLSHSGLLGATIGVVYGIGENLIVVVVCFLFGGLLVWLQQQRFLATDTLLGILAHGVLAVGLITLYFTGKEVGLYNHYLFGDIKSVEGSDIVWIYGAGVLSLGLLWWQWQGLLLATISEDLARAEGVAVFWLNMLLMFLLALVVGISFTLVGVLLITSLLIVPAATARGLVRSVEGMVVLSVFFGLISVTFGIVGAYFFGFPSGPSIAVVAVILFAVLFPLAVLRRSKKFGKEQF